jgi:holo-[acyl-carrier protein] synthase
MIVGIGTDVVQIPRIEKILQKYHDLFGIKILNSLEQEILQSTPKCAHASFLAKRFAAKEAISKALGTGIGSHIGFKDIVILNNLAGKPYVALENNIAAQNFKIDITIADDYPVAIAFAVVSMAH